MPPPLPPKAVAAFRILHFVEQVSYSESENHPARKLTNREVACRDAALDMLTYWFMNEIEIDEPFIMTPEEAEMVRELDRGDDREPVVVGRE